MELFDNTRNQHFISQVEQRQNTLNSNASKRNQKIYSFEVVDRESYTIRNRGAKKIETSLSINDLFCFSKLENDGGQFNFEKLFQRYEDDIAKYTESLINKAKQRNKDVSEELMSIFIAKFINFIRNPYSIKKVLNSFPSLLNVHPTDPTIYQKYEQVLKGRKPHQKSLSHQLDISDEQYEQWLRVIFMLLMPIDSSEHYNFLEGTIARMCTNSETMFGAILFTFDKDCCLLSDRGHNYYPLSDNNYAWEFNLNKNAFIRFGFTGIAELLGQPLTSEQLEFAKRIKHDVILDHRHNDKTELANYNKSTIYQAAKNVFSSSQNVTGL